MSDSVLEAVSEAASFVDKFRGRWPEWVIARVFVAAGQRDTAEHWFALLQEWTDAAATAEPAPGLAKLAWWQEELRGWAKGARRHPLGAVLQKQPVDWTAIADAMPALARRDAPDIDALDRLADVLAQAERVLFAEDRDGRAAIAAMLGDALSLTGAASQNTGEGARPRRLLAALRNTRNTTQQAPLTPWRTLRCSWRAARAGRPG